MFFVDHGPASYEEPTPKVQAAWDHAKAVCVDCPVMVQCARDCLGEVDGVWGGMDPAERLTARRKLGERLRLTTGRVKEEYARLAYELHERLGYTEAARLVGVNVSTAKYLVGWWRTHLEEQRLVSEGASMVQAAALEGMRPQPVARSGKVSRAHGTGAHHGAPATTG